MTLLRQAVAELIGTALLLVAVVGGGIMAVRLSPGQEGLQLLSAAITTGAALIAIIAALAPVSGAHLNPAVTLAAWLLGQLRGRQACVYIIAQLAGAAIGAILANLMFELAPISMGTTQRSGPGQWLGEAVATAGLLLVVFCLVRSGTGRLAPFAVGAWIAGAYAFTSSTSFANPAVTIARTLTDTFAGIRPLDVPAFVLVQLAATFLAVGVVWLLHPTLRPESELAATAPDTRETAPSPDSPANQTRPAPPRPGVERPARP